MSPILGPIALKSHCFCGPDTRFLLRERANGLHTDRKLSHISSFTLIKTPERGRKIGSVKNGWRGERGRARITGDRQNILRQTWLRKGDRRGGEIIKQNASAAAVLQISCQVPGPHSEIAGVRKTARETWREISRELKGQNTMSSHQGGGQSQVFTSTSPISV